MEIALLITITIALVAFMMLAHWVVNNPAKARAWLDWLYKDDAPTADWQVGGQRFSRKLTDESLSMAIPYGAAISKGGDVTPPRPAEAVTDDLDPRFEDMPEGAMIVLLPADEDDTDTTLVGSGTRRF